MTTNNPLKQYFRRPAVYIKLPSGGAGYPPGAIDIPDNGEIPIYPMTAIDEITSRTPDALFNGNAVVEIVRSCVPNIKDPWAITNVDLDPLLIAIRTATHGSEMEIETTCPNCDEASKYDVNLPTILVGFKPGDYSTPIVINEMSIKFRPLSYTELNKASISQFQIQKTMQNLMDIQDEEEKNHQSSLALVSINDAYIEMIASTVEYIKIPEGTVMEREFIVDFLRNCDKQTYDTIKDHSIQLRESTKNKPLQIKCGHCQHEYEQTFSVNVADFFD